MKVGWRGSYVSSYDLQKSIEEAVKKKKVQDSIIKQAKKRYKNVFWTMSEIEAEIVEFKQIIFNAAYETVMRSHYPRTNRFEGKTPNDLVRHKITKIQYADKDKRVVAYCKVEFKFHAAYIKSRSFRPSAKYPNGVDNIVRLLTNGWDFSTNKHSYNYRGYPRGDWHLGLSDKVIRNVMARTYHPGYPYMADAIQKYNSKQVKGKLTFSYLDSSYNTFYDTVNYPRILDTSYDYLESVLFNIEF